MDTSRPLKERYAELEHQGHEIANKMAQLKVMYNMGYRYLNDDDEPVTPDGVVNIHSGKV